MGIGFAELLILAAIPVLGLIGLLIVFFVVRTIMRAENQKSSESKR